MSQLTPRQREILDFLVRRTREAGAPPTRAEIALAFGFRSPNAAEEHLRALARHGVIDILPGRSRGLRLLVDVGANDAGRRLPVIGRVAAGKPILALEHVETEVAVDAGLFQPRADYLLRVRGDSMTGVGILEGDLLAVHRATTADTGQIVVARLGEEVTVKRLEHAAGGVRLIAENPSYAPIELGPETVDFTIEGIAVGVIRRW
jgi:repressor LexA